MKIRLQDVVRTGILAALAVALQAMTLPQPVTGPGINAVLFVASLYVGPLAGACVGIITPWVALLMGINKLAAAVPVIMLGNVTLALVAGYTAKFNKYVAMALAAVLKFAVMTLGIKYLMSTGTNIPAAAYTSLTITPENLRGRPVRRECYRRRDRRRAHQVRPPEAAYRRAPYCLEQAALTRRSVVSLLWRSRFRRVAFTFKQIVRSQSGNLTWVQGCYLRPGECCSRYYLHQHHHRQDGGDQTESYPCRPKRCSWIKHCGYLPSVLEARNPLLLSVR